MSALTQARFEKDEALLIMYHIDSEDSNSMLVLGQQSQICCIVISLPLFCSNRTSPLVVILITSGWMARLFNEINFKALGANPDILMRTYR